MARESFYAQLSATLLLLVVGFPLASSVQQLCTLQVTVLDNEGKPIPEAKRSVQREGHELFSASSDTEGLARIPGSPSGSYKIVAEKKAFFPASLPIDLTTLESAAELTLSTKRDESEKLEVRADAPGSEQQSASSSTTLERDEIKSLPNRLATVADARPRVPGVVRSADGQITIDGGGKDKSAFVVNGTGVTEPATGRFGFTVPRDILSMAYSGITCVGSGVILMCFSDRRP